MRSVAREVVYQYIFSKMFNNDDTDELLIGLIKSQKLNEEDKKFAINLSKVIIDNYNELLETLSEYTKHYKNRLFTTDKCALIIGLAEIKYFDDVPNVVAVDEAIKLSKKFSTERSQDFINGILGAILRGEEAKWVQK